MATYQIKYWFDTGSADRHGEMLSELYESPTVGDAANYVRENLTLPSFVIRPNFGPAVGGVAVINTAHIRFVEVVNHDTTVGVGVPLR